MQGVGETADASSRLLAYIRALEGRPLSFGAGGCAIANHFQDGEHCAADLAFTLVACVARDKYIHAATVNAVRVSLESYWIHRLAQHVWLDQRALWAHENGLP